MADEAARRERGNALRKADEQAKLRIAFKLFDKEGTGALSAEQLQGLLTYSRVCESKGLTLEDAQAILTENDTNGDGALQLDELLNGWDAISHHSAVAEAQERKEKDQPMFNEIGELESECLEKHLKMLTDLAAVVRTDATIDRELNLMDKIKENYEFGVEHKEEMEKPEVAEEFKAMSEELAAIECDNEGALADMYAEFNRAKVYDQKYKAMIAKMFETLGKTDNWYMSPPVLCRRKAVDKFLLLYVSGDSEEYIEVQERCEQMGANEARQKRDMFEELYDENFDGQVPAEADTDELAANFNASYKYDEDKWYADQEIRYHKMDMEVPDFLKNPNGPTEEQVVEELNEEQIAENESSRAGTGRIEELLKGINEEEIIGEARAEARAIMKSYDQLTTEQLAEVINLTDEQTEEFRENFDLFDPDATGAVPTEKLGTLMGSLGQHPTKAEVQAMIDEVDPEGTGTIQFAVFLYLMARSIKAMEGEDTEADLLEAFKAFDQDGNGFLDAAEFREAMTTLGEQMTDEEVDNMITSADVDGDGKINYEEFAKFMLGSSRTDGLAEKVEEKAKRDKANADFEAFWDEED